MANRNSKKCHKPSPTSSIGSTSASKQRSNKQKPPDILKLEDSNQDPIPTGEDNPASFTRTGAVPPMVTLIPHIYPMRRTKWPPHDGLPLCGTNINQPISNTSPSNLSKHVATCPKKLLDSKDQTLVAMGVTGAGDCAKAARPFSALGKRAHKGILHPVILRNLPTQKAVSNDISQLYTAVQENIIHSLKALIFPHRSFSKKPILVKKNRFFLPILFNEDHKGAMYLGLNAWQSPNGFDVLGTVLYRVVKGDGISVNLQAMPLDFVQLKKSHTGEYLAKNIRAIVEKFGIKDKIFGIVTNNASNNQTMIDTIKHYRWAQFKGEPHWSRSAQVILRPFGSHKKKKTISSTDDSDNGEEFDDLKDNIQLSDSENEDSVNKEDELPTDGTLAADLIDGEIELQDEDLSDKEDHDRYTSNLCKESLAKVSKLISRKLNKSPDSKACFVELCQEHECSRPHSIQHNVRARWNLTLIQLKIILRCAPSDSQMPGRPLYPPGEYHIKQDDLDLAKDLVEVLQPFYKITLQVSVQGAARIVDVVVFIDQITGHLSSAILDRREEYLPALRNAFLHPSFKDEYSKLAKWNPEWIEEALRLTREMWESNYKPQPPLLTTSQPSNPPPSRPVTGVLAGLVGASEARGASSPTNPPQMWLSGGLALTWWMQQQQAGNTHGGLLQMALDVLSCPATTVDVEQSLSFGRDVE
ncbi:hypothetical protein PSTG_05119 [Puccinia striiformis f. sp. tritici PST-78]|uniref:DUF659 domain-containing protein n=1 Tax=Puccinia striiformis f. sp. tritici PST-78 TaxID=1165861 RepID=A0A0L0VR51_9BASI|nr:hypothetical protein PSTG_05119 [Puccinia striiformis f. sp. tritici PST-78]